MKKNLSLLLATAIVGSFSLASLSTVAYAHDQNRSMGQQNSEMGQHQQMGKRGQMGQRGQKGGFLRLVCNDDGAERLETALEKFSGKITLSDEQTPLFEDFKSAALTAQTSFADDCTVPARGGDEDIVDRMENRQANMAAHLTAMEEVMPEFEAFFDSLTDEQKANLKPGQRGERGQRHGENGGDRDHDHDHDGGKGHGSHHNG